MNQHRGASMTDQARSANVSIFDALMNWLNLASDTNYVSNAVAQQHFVAANTSLQRIVDALVGYQLQYP